MDLEDTAAVSWYISTCNGNGVASKHFKKHQSLSYEIRVTHYTLFLWMATKCEGKGVY